ncbi:MAG: hypothetical protein V1707_00170, partial [bacterium]
YSGGTLINPYLILVIIFFLVGCHLGRYNVPVGKIFLVNSMPYDTNTNFSIRLFQDFPAVIEKEETLTEIMAINGQQVVCDIKIQRKLIETKEIDYEDFKKTEQSVVIDFIQKELEGVNLTEQTPSIVESYSELRFLFAFHGLRITTTELSATLAIRAIT